MIKLHISENLNILYNHAWSQPGVAVEMGDLIVSQNERLDLEAVMAGMGKRAVILNESAPHRSQVVDRFIADQCNEWKPSAVIKLDLSKMLDGNKYSVAQRIKFVPTVLDLTTEMTRLADPSKNFQLVLFVDSLFQLNQIGKPNLAGVTPYMSNFIDMLSKSGIPCIVGAAPDEYEDSFKYCRVFSQQFAKICLDNVVNV